MLALTYTNDDDGVHLQCDVEHCPESDIVLGYHVDIREAMLVAILHDSVHHAYP